MEVLSPQWSYITSRESPEVSSLCPRNTRQESELYSQKTVEVNAITTFQSSILQKKKKNPFHLRRVSFTFIMQQKGDLKKKKKLKLKNIFFTITTGQTVKLPICAIVDVQEYPLHGLSRDLSQCLGCYKTKRREREKKHKGI